MNLSETLAEIASLSIEERIEFVQALWDSIAADSDHLDPTPSQKGDLDRRIAELDAHPDRSLTWDEIKAGVRGAR